MKGSKTPSIGGVRLSEAAQTLVAARTRLAGLVVKLVFWGFTPMVLGVLAIEVAKGRHSPVLWIVVGLQLIPCSYVIPGLWASARTTPLLLSYGFGMAISTTLLLGPVIALGIPVVTAGIWSGLMHKQRGALAFAVVVFVMLLGLGALVTSGLVAPLAADFLDVGVPVHWLRIAFIMGFAAVVCGWLIIELLDEYRAAALGTKSLLASEWEERQRNETLAMALRKSQRSEAIHRLAEEAGHAINHALSDIVCSAQELLNSDDPAETELAQGIILAAGNARKATPQLVSPPRSVPGGIESCNLVEVMARFEKTIRRGLSPDINVTVSEESGRDIAMTAEDLERCLLNLFINARDALPDGRGDISVVAQPLDHGRRIGGAVISVNDTGSGMDPNTRDQVFQPFFTTKAPGVGTGLGLFAVRTLVEATGGEVRCVSTLGVGTLFTLEIGPALDAAPEPPKGPTSGPQSSREY